MGLIKKGFMGLCRQVPISMTGWLGTTYMSTAQRIACKFITF